MDVFLYSDLLFYILAGAAVGFLVGLTGVGGGSLMTPLLILFNIPYHIAIGTDLLYATITKANGVLAHNREHNIHWSIVGWLALGSIPASLITVLALHLFFTETPAYKAILTTALGIMLIITSGVLFARDAIKRYGAGHKNDKPESCQGHKAGKTRIITVCSGVLLGVCVTLSSVGAGAFGTAILMLLYTQLSSRHIIGTDIAHAVPLTFIAGMGHFILLGNVDFFLLAGLLIGSIPAVYVGSKLSSRLPDRLMFTVLAGLLLILGIRFAFF